MAKRRHRSCTKRCKAAKKNMKRMMQGARYIGTHLIVGPIRSGPAALPPGLKKGGMMHKSCKCKVSRKCMCH